jgi:poly(hydroxyalkanoate) granule-associated protein
MLKKAKAGSATGASDLGKDLADAVFDSSHQIWLAGLGAFSRAQQEGMKVFESLVRQGERLQERTRRAAADTAAAARGAASAKAKEVQQMAGGTWDKLEQVFEDRVARAWRSWASTRRPTCSVWRSAWMSSRTPLTA